MLADLNDAFLDRIQEIRGFLHLRIEDKSKGQFQQDLVGLESNVRVLEQHVAELKSFLRREEESASKVECLLEACRVQSKDIQSIQAAFPQQTAAATAGIQGSRDSRDQTKAEPAAAQAAALEERRAKKKESIPRWYVSEAELASISSYMRGRVTLDKINAAVDEMAKHAENTVRLVTSVRSQPSKLSPAERKRATDLLHSVAGKEGFKGRFWFQESDMGRDGEVLKLDKTGKAIMTMMRHLGRVQEVRLTVAGTANCIFYILNSLS